MDKKILQVDLKAARDTVAAKAKTFAVSAQEFARTKKAKAMSGLLDKGIALSERQLAALRSAKQHLS